MKDENYIWFTPGVQPPEHDKNQEIWFIFNGNKLMTQEIEGKGVLPKVQDLHKYSSLYEHVHYIGQLRGKYCFTAELSKIEIVENIYKFYDFRSIIPYMNDEEFLLCSKAIQVINWDKDHKFCGRCGSLMETSASERARTCPKCGLINYPRISPAIIVAITNGDKLLLAHNKNFKSGVYSLIAGFVEVGETFEQCVKREIMEEVGIKVKNIKYIQSQPWPFPNSLMIAFMAEYVEGEINPDGVEIEDAGWYTTNNMPIIPPAKGSVARKLIDRFINSNS